jgi:hypothetical protein
MEELSVLRRHCRDLPLLRREILGSVPLACLAGLSSLMLLALVRGDVLAQAARSAAAVVTLTQDSAPPPPPAEDTFYDRTLCLLRLLMSVLALAMEIGAGLALFEARRLGAASGDDPAPIEQSLRELGARMIAKFEELRRLQNQASVFQNEFWRDFYRALSDGLTHRSIVKRDFWAASSRKRARTSKPITSCVSYQA